MIDVQTENGKKQNLSMTSIIPKFLETKGANYKNNKEEEFQEFQYNLAYQSTCWSKLKSKFIPCAHHTLLLNDKPPILRLDLTVKVRCLDPE